MSLLSWSPNGEYVLEGGLDGSFRVWETHKWTDALWTSQVLLQPLRLPPHRGICCKAVVSLLEPSRRQGCCAL